VADPSVTPQIDKLLAERFGAREPKPAVTFVETAMPRAGILVAMDAIAATAWMPEQGRGTRLAARPGARGSCAEHRLQRTDPDDRRERPWGNLIELAQILG
jgi:hypothetical protein